MSKEMDDLVAAATDKLEHLEDALHGLNQLRARFTTTDGAVTAEVDGSGALSGLWLDETVTEMDARELGQLVTWAAHQAAQRAGDRRTEIIANLNKAFEPSAATQ